jgi:hypothetical protein
VPDDEHDTAEDDHRGPTARAEHEAAEIVARAHRQAEAIVSEARSSAARPTVNPLAALGDNAEEVIGQVRKLITKQRAFQAEREEMLAEIETLRSERDELVQRLTDAVERMEELAQLADAAQNRQPMPSPPTMAPSPPPPPTSPARTYDPDQEDTSLAARLRHAEEAEAAAHEPQPAPGDGEAEHQDVHPRAEDDDEYDPDILSRVEPAMIMNSDGRSFYDRHSAKLPRLEGDGGRSVLSAIGDMRPEPDTKNRKGRRRKK